MFRKCLTIIYKGNNTTNCPNMVQFDCQNPKRGATDEEREIENVPKPVKMRELCGFERESDRKRCAVSHPFTSSVQFLPVY